MFVYHQGDAEGNAEEQRKHYIDWLVETIERTHRRRWL